MACFTRGLLLPGLRSGAARSLLFDLPAARARLSTTCLRPRQANGRAIDRQLKNQAAEARAAKTAKTQAQAQTPKATKAQAQTQPQPQAKAPKPRQASPSQTPSPSPALNQSLYGFQKALAAKARPTILYEGASHFWFYFGCWSTASAITAFILWVAPTVLYSDQVPTWYIAINAVSYVAFAAIGFKLVAATPNIIQRIRFVPGKALPRPGSAPTGRLEVTVNSALPFVKPRVITTDAANVSLKSRLALPDHLVPELVRAQQKLEDEAKRRALRKFDMEHLLTMPFRQIGRVSKSIFQGVRAGFTDMGFGRVTVNGKEYKLDVTKGYAHDGFRTLEKLVPVVP
jgi:hypothetical protein